MSGSSATDGFEVVESPTAANHSPTSGRASACDRTGASGLVAGSDFACSTAQHIHCLRATVLHALCWDTVFCCRVLRTMFTSLPHRVHGVLLAQKYCCRRVMAAADIEFNAGGRSPLGPHTDGDSPEAIAVRASVAQSAAVEAVYLSMLARMEALAPAVSRDIAAVTQLSDAVAGLQNQIQ